MSSSEPIFPREPGSYLLWLYLPRKTSLGIGRLGEQSLRRGWYAYSGSAFGPGGLNARLNHHLKPPQRFHWHIDYLRTAANLRFIYYQTHNNNEHVWAKALLSLPGASQPLKRFGSSDCACFSHLTYLPKFPLKRELNRLIVAAAGSVSVVCRTVSAQAKETN